MVWETVGLMMWMLRDVRRSGVKVMEQTGLTNMYMPTPLGHEVLHEMEMHMVGIPLQVPVRLAMIDLWFQASMIQKVIVPVEKFYQKHKGRKLSSTGETVLDGAFTVKSQIYEMVGTREVDLQEMNDAIDFELPDMNLWQLHL